MSQFTISRAATDHQQTDRSVIRIDSWITFPLIRIPSNDLRLDPNPSACESASPWITSCKIRKSSNFQLECRFSLCASHRIYRHRKTILAEVVQATSTSYISSYVASVPAGPGRPQECVLDFSETKNNTTLTLVEAWSQSCEAVRDGYFWAWIFRHLS
jgi:hypothetical protein